MFHSPLLQMVATLVAWSSQWSLNHIYDVSVIWDPNIIEEADFVPFINNPPRSLSTYVPALKDTLPYWEFSLFCNVIPDAVFCNKGSGPKGGGIMENPPG